MLLSIADFFKYKGYLDYHGEDFFGLTHIIIMVVATIAIILINIFLRKMSHKKLEILLKITAIILPIFEVTKIVWESYFDIKFGRGFSFGGILPLYTCSLFMYILPFACFCKNKIVKDYALSFIVGVGIFAGLTNFYLTNVVHYYPVLHIASLHALFYHFMMVLIGTLVVSTGYYKVDKFTPLKALVPLAICAIVIIPVDYILKADYGLFYRADGAPLLPKLASFLASHHVRFIFTILMFVIYLLIAYVVFGVIKLITLINNKITNKGNI